MRHSIRRFHSTFVPDVNLYRVVQQTDVKSILDGFQQHDGRHGGYRDLADSRMRKFRAVLVETKSHNAIQLSSRTGEALMFSSGDLRPNAVSKKVLLLFKVLRVLSTCNAYQSAYDFRLFWLLPDSLRVSKQNNAKNTDFLAASKSLLLL